MGSSKVIVITGLFIVLGFYTISFNAADETNFVNANNSAMLTQSEQLARTGVELALQYMADDGSKVSYSRTYYNGTDTVTYSATGTVSTTANIVSTAYCNGKIKKISAVLHFHNNRWKILRTYTAV